MPPFRNWEYALGFKLEDAAGSYWDAEPASAQTMFVLKATADSVRKQRARAAHDFAQASPDPGQETTLGGVTTGAISMHLCPNLATGGTGLELTELGKWLFKRWTAPASAYTFTPAPLPSAMLYGGGADILGKTIKSAVCTGGSLEWTSAAGAAGFLGCNANVVAYDEAAETSGQPARTSTTMAWASQAPYGPGECSFTKSSTDYIDDITRIGLSWDKGVDVESLMRGGTDVIADPRNAWGLWSVQITLDIVPNTVFTSLSTLTTFLADEAAFSWTFTRGAKTFEVALGAINWPEGLPEYVAREGLVPMSLSATVTASAHGYGDAIEVEVDGASVNG